MRRALRIAALILIGLAATLVLAALLTLRPGNRALFPAQGDGIDAYLVSNGYHSGLVLPVETLRHLAEEDGQGAVSNVATRFQAYDWVELGWGEARFYTEVPTIERLNWRLALSALLTPGNASVIHVVGVQGAPREVFDGADVVHLRLSETGLRRLIVLLERSFKLDAEGMPEEIGPGLYGPSLFYGANEAFHLFNVCNHWTARLLDAAGVPTAPMGAILPSGLLLDLHWRSGLRPLPKRSALDAAALGFL